MHDGRERGGPAPARPLPVDRVPLLVVVAEAAVVAVAARLGRPQRVRAVRVVLQFPESGEVSQFAGMHHFPRVRRHLAGVCRHFAGVRRHLAGMRGHLAGVRSLVRRPHHFTVDARAHRGRRRHRHFHT